VYKRKRKYDTLIRHNHKCKQCTNKYQKEYYKKNFDSINARHHKYYQENREAQLAQQRIYQDSFRGHVTYRLDFPNGTYWYGSTVNLHKRLHLHNYRLANGTHAVRMLALCGGPDYECTTLETFSTQRAARDAEMVLLQEHVGKEKCLNSVKAASMYEECA
jgi:hypothetical protein